VARNFERPASLMPLSRSAADGHLGMANKLLAEGFQRYGSETIDNDLSGYGRWTFGFPLQQSRSLRTLSDRLRTTCPNPTVRVSFVR